jgi:hypothetical protein
MIFGVDNLTFYTLSCVGLVLFGALLCMCPQIGTKIINIFVTQKDPGQQKK